MKYRLSLAIAAVAIAVAGVLAYGNTEQTVANSANSTSGEGFDLIAVAHPDDEMSQKAREQRSDNFQVFTLVTRGGASVICEDYGGRYSEECKDKRVESFIGFHNEDFPDVEYQRSTKDFDLYTGPESMLVVFDYEDAALKENEAKKAIRTTLNLDELDDKTFELLVDGNYASDEEDYYEYEHPDHLAVSNVVRDWNNVDRLSVTSPKYADLHQTVNDYDYYMDCEEGIFNEHYGWLRPPCWPTDGTGGFTEDQYYWFESSR